MKEIGGSRGRPCRSLNNVRKILFTAKSMPSYDFSLVFSLGCCIYMVAKFVFVDDIVKIISEILVVKEEKC